MKRYFNFYDNFHPEEYETKRIINVQNILDVIEIDNVGKQEHCFKIILHKNSLILSADSGDSRQMWIQIMKKRILIYSSI